MTLKERLPDLYGQQVKIGGYVGFLYCGDAFDGLENLIDNIGESEKERLDILADNAKKAYKNRDISFEIKINTTKQTIEYETKRIKDIDYFINYYEKKIANYDYYLRTERAWYWVKYFRMRRDEARESKENLRLQRKGAEKTLRRNKVLLDSLEGPYAKNNWDVMLRRKMEKTIAERDEFTTLSEAEILEEYPIQMYEGTILILKTLLCGKYWDESECLKDIPFQRKVHRARKYEW